MAKGGLGLAPRAIGLILGLQGIITGLVQVFFFAPIHKRLGSKRLHFIGLMAYLLLTLSLPAMHFLASRGMVYSMRALIAVHLVFSCLAFMAFSELRLSSLVCRMLTICDLGCIAIFVANSAPSKSSLGTLNGVSQTTISVIRAVGPATATSLFAVSVQKDLLGGWFVYAVLTGVNILGLIASRWLTEEKRGY